MEKKKNEKKNYFIFVLIVLSVIGTFLLGLISGTSFRTEVIAEKNDVVEVRRASNGSIYADYVAYNPLETSIPNLPFYSSNLVNNRIFACQTPNSTGSAQFLEISAYLYDDSRPTVSSSNVATIYAPYLFVVINAYSYEEDARVYYYFYDRLSNLSWDLNDSNYLVSGNIKYDTFEIGIIDISSDYEFLVDLTYTTYQPTGNIAEGWNNVSTYIYNKTFYCAGHGGRFLYSTNNAVFNNTILMPYALYLSSKAEGYRAGENVAVQQDGWLGGVFNVFEKASSVFVNVMNVQIFPGITLGALVLFPLVILLISLIIKIFFGG